MYNSLLLICFFPPPGGLYALPGEWPIHYGRLGFQFPFYNWGPRFCDVGPDQQANDTQAQPHPPPVCVICLHTHLIFHVQSLHENEIAVSTVH